MKRYAPEAKSEKTLDALMLESIFVNTLAALRALDGGLIPEDQQLPALAGMAEAYVEILAPRYGTSLDDKITARIAGIKAFAIESDE